MTQLTSVIFFGTTNAVVTTKIDLLRIITSLELHCFDETPGLPSKQAQLLPSWRWVSLAVHLTPRQACHCAAKRLLYGTVAVSWSSPAVCVSRAVSYTHSYAALLCAAAEMEAALCRWGDARFGGRAMLGRHSMQRHCPTSGWLCWVPRRVSQRRCMCAGRTAVPHRSHAAVLSDRRYASSH